MKNQHYFSSVKVVLSYLPLRWLFLFMMINFLLVYTIKGQTNVKVTGTGQTTGHIANLTITNTTSESLHINPQIAFIPSDGKYQSYVASVPETTILPTGTLIIPVTGYCADVHSPPVPNGTTMPPIEKWLPVGDPALLIPEGTVNLLPTKTFPEFVPLDIITITQSPGYTPITRDGSGITINWPDTDIPVGGVMDPKKDPETFAPVIVEVLADIIDVVDIILKDDQYDTPFSGNPEKERESVIQQTFWIYMAAATGDEYTQDDFEEKVYDQFQTSNGKTVASLPEEQKKKIDDGIGDFWNTFTAVGVEAKILSIPKAASGENGDPVLISDENEKVIKVDEISQAERYNQDLKNCFFSKLEYSIFFTHIYTRGSGKKKERSVDHLPADENNTVELKLKKDDTLRINLEDLKCACPCWTAINTDGQKSGPICECTITGTSLRSYNDQALTDLMEEAIDKIVMDSLRKEIAAKMEEIKMANGRQSEINKLQKQLDDEKKLRRENSDRIQELKQKLNGSWRLANDITNAAFKVMKTFYGQIEFVFDIQGKCASVDECKGSEFSREVKVIVKVPR